MEQSVMDFVYIHAPMYRCIYVHVYVYMHTCICVCLYIIEKVREITKYYSCHHKVT